MKLSKRDITFRYTRGQGPGGQRKNKVETCVHAKHTPTGIEVKVDGRNRHQNKREAVRRLAEAVAALLEDERAAVKKARRDDAIASEERVRTYDFCRNVVTDHRSGRTASLKDVLGKGKLEKLR
jgi:protein subunit release factor A